MITDTELKAIIIENLNNFMMYGIQVNLLSLIDRGPDTGSIPRYRLKYNGADITTWADLLAKISLSGITVTPSTRPSMFPTAAVEFNNISVALNDLSPADARWLSTFGNNVSKLVFDMANVYDADLVLPLKITRINLI